MNVQFEDSPKQKKQGSINIDYVPENQNIEKTEDIKGDYVDFEEIK